LADAPNNWPRPGTQLGMNAMMGAFMAQALSTAGRSPSMQEMLQHMIGEPAAAPVGQIVQTSHTVPVPQAVPGTGSAGHWTPGDLVQPLIGDNYGPPTFQPMMPVPGVNVPWYAPPPNENAAEELLRQIEQQQKLAQAEAQRKQHRALLRPLAAPLYDTSPITQFAFQELDFFKTGLGEEDERTGKIKTPWQTNVGPGGRLVTPDEFEALGISFALTGADQWVAEEIRDRALIRYKLNGKIIFEIPMIRVPVTATAPLTDKQIASIPLHAEAEQKDDILLAAQTGKALEEIRESRVTPVEYYADEVERMCERNRSKPNFYQFTISKKPLRLTPQDSFQVQIAMPEQITFGGIPETARITCFMEGNLWRIP